MPTRLNSLGQPIGDPVSSFGGAALPPRTSIEGRYCRVEPLDPDRHAAPLFEAICDDEDGRSWTYMAYGPFASLDEYRAWMTATCLGDDPLFFAIVDLTTGQPAGVASLMRIDRRCGIIEVGHIHYSPRLQRTRAATEAMYLLMRRVFDELGYRRYEWKCDALNEPSRRAAERLGFTYEGTFRKATIYKGRNRDTAWFSIVDDEWPSLKEAYEAWLDPSSFDAEGKQRRSLRDLTADALERARRER
jgi:RimJ/RimL family protein N-acetyltransferase